MSRTWIISDTHFYHANIIKYENRPENHDELMLNALAEKVGEEDTLIHVGDVLFAKNSKQGVGFCNDLPGKNRILIMGNHDRSYLKKAKWDHVVPMGEVWKTEVDGHEVAFCHFPPYTPNWDGISCPIKIHGHTHSKCEKVRLVDGELLINACVEKWNYQPFELQEALDIWQGK